MSGNFFGGQFFGGGFFGALVSTTDTHDGVDPIKRRIKDQERLDAFRRSRQELRSTLNRAFNETYGLPVEEEIVAEAEPFVEQIVEKKATTLEIDWDALRADVAANLRLRRLVEEYAIEMAQIDDEETMMLL